MEVDPDNGAAGVSGWCGELKCFHYKRMVREILHHQGFGNILSQEYEKLMETKQNTKIRLYLKKRKIRFESVNYIQPGPGWSLALSSSLDVCPLELESTSLTPESAGLGGREPEKMKEYHHQHFFLKIQLFLIIIQKMT